MRRTVLVLIVTALLATACGNSSQGIDTGDGGTDSATAEVMAASLRQVATVDHTFGQGPPPFTRYLVQASTDPGAGDGTSSGESRPLTDTEQTAIAAALENLGAVEFIDDPDEWRTEDLAPTVEGSVILGVGEPSIDGNTALVPVSLWCGGLCGTWLTYRVELSDGTWTVTGIAGPIAVS